MIEYVYGLASGIFLGANLAALVRFLRSRVAAGRPKPAPEFKLAENQNPIDPAMIPGETVISKVDYRRQTASRRLVRGSGQPRDLDDPR